MPLIPISSVDDPRLAVYRALPKSQLAQESGAFIAEGDKVTERMLRSCYEPLSLLVEQDFVTEWQTLAPPEIPLYVVTRDIMCETVGFKFHRGVMGCGRRPGMQPLERIVPAREEACLLTICPETQDPTNLGTMVRTATALGSSGLLLGPQCADVFSRRVIRVSMGAVFETPLRLAFDIQEDLRELRDRHGIELCATVLDPNAEPLDDFVPSKRTALLIGSEGHGLREDVVAMCDRRVTIPMPPSTDSLNAAVATGIFLHHFSRAVR